MIRLANFDRVEEIGEYQNIYNLCKPKNAEAQTDYLKALECLKKSATAQRIITYVEEHVGIIDLIVCADAYNGGFYPAGNFAQGAMIRSKGAAGAVLWSPTMTFDYYRTANQVGMAPRGGLSKQGFALLQWGSEIILAHELGHCKQLFEDYGNNPNQMWDEYQRDMIMIEQRNIAENEAPVAVELGHKPRVMYNMTPGNAWEVRRKKIR